MPCRPLIGEDGKVIGFACGPGRYTHIVMASCPFCCLGTDQTFHAFREVYGGYCAPDMICGACGQTWTADDNVMPRPMTEEEREEGKELVAQMMAAGIEVGPSPIPSALTYEDERGGE